MSFMHLLGGDLDLAVEKTQGVIDTTDPARGLLYVYIGYGFSGWAYSRMGEHQTALDRFALSKAFGESLGGRLILADAFTAAEAEIFAASGRNEEAITLAENAVSMAKAGGGMF